jgi:hypothetical protein
LTSVSEVDKGVAVPVTGFLANPCQSSPEPSILAGSLGGEFLDRRSLSSSQRDPP